MKLILCKYCNDVVKLRFEKTTCECGKCWGQYVDPIYAVINKEAIPIGFNNYSLIEAIKQRPKEGKGSLFEAFVIPKKCGTVKVER